MKGYMIQHKASKKFFSPLYEVNGGPSKQLRKTKGKVYHSEGDAAHSLTVAADTSKRFFKGEIKKSDFKVVPVTITVEE